MLSATISLSPLFKFRKLVFVLHLLDLPVSYVLFVDGTCLPSYCKVCTFYVCMSIVLQLIVTTFRVSMSGMPKHSLTFSMQHKKSAQFFLSL